MFFERLDVMKVLAMTWLPPEYDGLASIILNGTRPPL